MEHVRGAWCPAVVIGVMACADAPGLGMESSTGGASSSAGTGPGGPPQVIDIGHDVLLLREGEAVVLTVVVVDPDDDVVAGELLGPGEPGEYGGLSPHPNGRWRASVRWSDVNAQELLQFEGERALPFTVRMVDAEGHVATADTLVRAACGGLTNTACAGTCVDAQLDTANCGVCDRACVVGEPLAGQDVNGGCMGGDCQPWWGGCAVPEPGSTCASQCATEGGSCAAKGCGAETLARYEFAGECERGVEGVLEPLECDDALGAGAAVRCCCA